MYAVIRTGGKQYKVAQGDVITVEKLAGQAGDAVTFDQVLALDDGDLRVGTPVLDGASVSAEVLEQTRGDKIIVFKKKRRKNYRRKRGHRQYITVLRVTDIAAEATNKRAAKKPAADAAPEPAEAPAPEPTEAPAAAPAPADTPALKEE